MTYDKYYEARDIVTDILKKDLLGPVTEDEIIFNSVDIWKTYRDIYDDNGNYVGENHDNK